MNRIRKMLALLLAFVMVLGSVPVSAAEARDTSDDEFYKVVHLDAARKYFSVAQVKKVIDNCADAGMNQLQFYFSDNQGLRLKLDDMTVTTASATYDLTPALGSGYIQSDKGMYPQDGATAESYLTQSEMTEIIAYAKEKGIEIVPAFNSPGHMGAILEAFPGFCYSNNSGTTKSSIDLENQEAVAFGLAVVKLYADYFAEQGAKFFNIGGDEYANDLTSDSNGFAVLINNELYDDFVAYLNNAAQIVIDNGMTPRMFNDGAYFGDNFSAPYKLNSAIQICYWSTNGFAGAATPAEIKAQGHQLINTHKDLYYVVAKSPWTCVTEQSAAAFNKNTFFGGSTIDDPAGTMLCIWCDDARDETMTSDRIISNTDAIFEAYGKTLPDTANEVSSPLVPGVSLNANNLEAINVTEVEAPDALTDVADDKALTYTVTATTKDGSPYTGPGSVAFQVPDGWNSPMVRGFITYADGTVTEEIKGVYDSANGTYTFDIPHLSEITNFGIYQSADVAINGGVIHLTKGQTHSFEVNAMGEFVAENTDIANGSLGAYTYRKTSEIVSGGQYFIANINYDSGKDTIVTTEFWGADSNRSWPTATGLRMKVITEGTDVITGNVLTDADLWIITETGTTGEYHVKTPAGKYLNVAANDTVNLSDDPKAVSIGTLGTGYQISNTSKEISLNYFGDGNYGTGFASAWNYTNSNSNGSAWNLYRPTATLTVTGNEEGSTRVWVGNTYYTVNVTKGIYGGEIRLTPGGSQTIEVPAEGSISVENTGVASVSDRNHINQKATQIVSGEKYFIANINYAADTDRLLTTSFWGADQNRQHWKDAKGIRMAVVTEETDAITGDNLVAENLWTIESTGTEEQYCIYNQAGEYISINGNNDITSSSAPVALQFRTMNNASGNNTGYQISKIDTQISLNYFGNGGSGNAIKTFASGYTFNENESKNGYAWNLYRPTATLTVTGNEEGSTRVWVGNTYYDVIVENLDDTVTLYYYLSSFQVWEADGTVDGQNPDNKPTSVTIKGADANTEDGVVIYEVKAPANGEWRWADDKAPTLYWKSTMLSGEANWQTKHDQDTSDNGGRTIYDMSLNGVDFTHIRYYDGMWQVKTSNDIWLEVTNDDQLVAYYLMKTQTTEEVATYVKDWAFTTTDNPNGEADRNQKALSFAVVYPDGQMKPAEEDIYKNSTLLYWDNLDNLGFIFFRELYENYSISHITYTLGQRTGHDELANTHGHWGADESITWNKENGWYDETTVWEVSSGTTPVVDGRDLVDVIYPGNGGTNGTNFDGSWGKDDAVLLLVYLEVKGNLDIKYVDDTTGTEFYQWQISAHDPNATFDSIVENSDGRTHLKDGATIQNTLGVHESIETDITKISRIDEKYRTGLYEYQYVEVADDGKTLIIHYSYNSTKPLDFVVDFGLPVMVDLSHAYSDKTVTGVTVDGETVYGAVTTTGTSITYTPATVLKDMESVSVTTSFEGAAPETRMIRFIPATTVYYEEGFATFGTADRTEGVTAGWSGGSEGDGIQQASVPGIDKDFNNSNIDDYNYGYDSAYVTAEPGPSNGSQAVSAKEKDTATFDFKGTGVEIYTNNAANTGNVIAYLYANPTEESNGKLCGLYAVDTMMKDGYTDGTTSQAVTAYNVPIINIRDLEHGDYRVVLRHVKQTLDTVVEEVRFDGFRVIGTLPMDHAAYVADGESDPEFAELRDAALLASLPKATEGTKDYGQEIANGIASQVYAYASNENLILNATMSASSKETNDFTFAAEKAGDGDPNTRWSSATASGANGALVETSEWLAAEFAEDQLIAQINLVFHDRGTTPAMPSNTASFSVKYVNEEGLEVYAVEDHPVTSIEGLGGYDTRAVVVFDTPIVTKKLMLCDFVTKMGSTEYNSVGIVELEAYAVKEEDVKTSEAMYKAVVVTADEPVTENQGSTSVDLTGNLLAYYDFETVDENGIVNNNVKSSADYAATLKHGATIEKQLFGNSLKLDAIGEGLQLTGILPSDANGITNFTVSMWYKADNNPTSDVMLLQQGIMGTGGNQGAIDGRSLLMATSNKTYYSYMAGSRAEDDTAVGDMNVWQHVSMVYEKTESGQQVTFYANGTAIGTEDLGSTAVANVTDMIIGRHRNDNVNQFKGLFDEVRVYNEAITAEKAAAIYADGKAALQVATVTDPVDNGPKNEIYLQPNQTLVFKIHATDAQIGLKALNVATSYTLQKNSDEAKVAELTSSTDMYYNLDPAGEQVTYTLTNTGEGILSVTLLKLIGAHNVQAISAQDLQPALVSMGYALAAAPETTPVTEVFSDVAANEWYTEAVQYVYDKGIMSGSNGTFNPTKNMTRAQLVMTLYNLEDSPKSTDRSACDKFTDVKSGEWYTDAVCWAYSNGITNGNSANTFGVNVSLTREQLVTFLYNYASKKGLDTNAAGDLSNLLNADKAAAYAVKPFEWAVGKGIIGGINGSDLAPKATATRAQLAVIVKSFCEVYDL